MKTGLKVVKPTLLKTRSLKNRWTISQQPIVEQIGNTFLGENRTVEKSLNIFFGDNLSGKMIVKENFMDEDTRLVIFGCAWS